MNERQRKFWGPYIMALGFENFYTNGMFIQSKHYCGMDISLAEGAEEFGASQLEAIIKKHTIYKELLSKPALNNEDLEQIFTWLVEKPFFDEELVHDRRGHWRTYPSGKRGWVKACKVGDASKGVVFKDYEVVTSQTS